MNATFLSGCDVLESFDRLAPVFEKLPRIDDFDINDLAKMASEGRMHIGYADQDGDIRMVMAFEFIRYPKILVVNIAAMAGRDLDGIADQYFGKFKEFCELAGADAIDAYCSDAMMRILARYGMKKIRNQVRIIL